MSIPVGMIPYTNMAPYRQLGAPQGCHFVPLTPSASVEALVTGRVVAAAVPVGGLTRLETMVNTVGRFGIAAKGPSMSVLFFSRVPFEAMHAPKTLWVTEETASSVQLLYLLLGQTHGFDRLPHLVSDSQRAHAKLLIGDRALVRGATAKRDDVFSHVTDLSQSWFRSTGLPFVFARWVVSKDVAPAVKTAIARWLDEFKEKEAVLVAQAAPQAARTLDLSLDLIQRYFHVIRWCLDDSDIQGQLQFLAAMQRLGRTPLFKRLDKGLAQG